MGHGILFKIKLQMEVILLIIFLLKLVLTKNIKNIKLVYFIMEKKLKDQMFQIIILLLKRIGQVIQL
jgi:hypothetical protein